MGAKEGSEDPIMAQGGNSEINKENKRFFDKMVGAFPDREDLRTREELDNFIRFYVMEVHKVFQEMLQEKLGIEIPLPIFETGNTKEIFSKCGVLPKGHGPLYCIPDGMIFINTDEISNLVYNLKLHGTKGVIFMIAHEYAHHLQTELFKVDKNRGFDWNIRQKSNFSKFIRAFPKLEGVDDIDDFFLDVREMYYHPDGLLSEEDYAVVVRFMELWADSLAGLLHGYVEVNGWSAGRQDVINRSKKNSQELGNEIQKTLSRLGDDYLADYASKMSTSDDTFLSPLTYQHGAGWERILFFKAGYDFFADTQPKARNKPLLHEALVKQYLGVDMKKKEFLFPKGRESQIISEIQYVRAEFNKNKELRKKRSMRNFLRE